MSWLSWSSTKLVMRWQAFSFVHAKSTCSHHLLFRYVLICNKVIRINKVSLRCKCKLMDKFGLHLFNQSHYNFKEIILVLKYFYSVYYWYIKRANISLSRSGFFFQELFNMGIQLIIYTCTYICNYKFLLKNQKSHLLTSV